MTVDVLGTEYGICYHCYEDDEMIKDNGVSGYCNDISKQIVVGKMSSYPDWENTDKYECEQYEKTTLRHEILHAFLSESGLSDSAMPCDTAWAKNEEMIDWFAMQGKKIYEAWQAVDAI
jgi:hypothetical protein